MGLHLAGRFHLSAIFMPHTFQAALNTLSTYIFLQGHHFQKHNLHLKEEIEVTSPPASTSRSHYAYHKYSQSRASWKQCIPTGY